MATLTDPSHIDFYAAGRRSLAALIKLECFLFKNEIYPTLQAIKKIARSPPDAKCDLSRLSTQKCTSESPATLPGEIKQNQALITYGTNVPETGD
ncbi:TPA: hypothetical protein LVL75_001709 [Klebsiella oxytoca]|nr:hypothetical protein [Klebsiella oxytoca]